MAPSLAHSIILLRLLLAAQLACVSSSPSRALEEGAAASPPPPRCASLRVGGDILSHVAAQLAGGDDSRDVTRQQRQGVMRHLLGEGEGQGDSGSWSPTGVGGASTGRQLLRSSSFLLAKAQQARAEECRKRDCSPE